MNDSITVAIPSIPPREAFLARAVRSVEAQTLAPNFTSVALDSHGEGATATRNRAWRAHESEWVAFLDDDDELLPHHLEHLLAVAHATGADMVYPWHTIIGPTGAEIPTLWPGVQGRPFDPVELFGKADPADEFDVGPDARNYIPITNLVRRELLEAIGGFEDLSDHTVGAGNEDWLAWRRCVLAGAKIVHTPEITWIWHHHGANTAGLPSRWLVNAPGQIEAPL